MTASPILPYVHSTSVGGRSLRPSHKVLPEHARTHNRALVLQTIYAEGAQSRADIARATGLTRVTVSALVSDLIAEGLIAELGPRDGVHLGKPAIVIDIDRTARQIIGIDLSGRATFRGAVLDLGGEILSRHEIVLDGCVGEQALKKALALVEVLISAANAPILGIGVGSPGIVDDTGVVLSAANLGWFGQDLQRTLTERFSLPTMVVNDARAAVLAEHSFGEADGDMMLVRVGRGVGAGLLIDGVQVFGSRFAAGEIGHVVVDPDGDLCSCGKYGCLETWLAAPQLEAQLAAASTSADRSTILRDAGTKLGLALAPIVGALNLSEIVLGGSEELLGGELIAATRQTLRERTMDAFHGGLRLRLTSLGDDIVLRGAAVSVVSKQLGFS